MTQRPRPRKAKSAGAGDGSPQAGCTALPPVRPGAASANQATADADANAAGAAAPAAPVSAFTPLPYQRAWVADAARFKIGLMARQVGKSTACALEVNDDILRTEAGGGKTLWVLLSRGERQSGELARKVRDFGRLVYEARKLLSPDLVELSGNVSEIHYAGGSRVIALPANPDTARGYSGNVVLDEFAFHHDSDAIWTALFPTITRGFRVRVISTPNGQQNRFYQLWSEAQAQSAAWSAHKVTIADAIEQGLGLSADELRAGIRDEEAWRQEYLCEFIDEATAWLTWDMIRACEDPRAAMSSDAARLPASGVCYAGWDVARWHDLSVLWLVERVGDVLWTRHVEVMRRMPFEAQLARVRHVCMRQPHFARLCIDATGMGEMVAERAADTMGGRVEGVKFTGGVKEVLAGDLRRAIEDRRLRLPIDEDVRGDLHSVRCTTTAAGNRRFEGESGGSHADRFWALALAVHAAGAGEQHWIARPDSTLAVPPSDAELNLMREFCTGVTA